MAEATKPCPFCAQGIDAAAMRCPRCDRPLPEDAAAATPAPLGLIGTWSAAMLRPTDFFSRPAAQRSRLAPLLFIVAVCAVVLPARTLTLTLPQQPASLGVGLLAFVLSPLYALASAYVHAGLLHLALHLVRGRRAPFRETMACVCHATAPMILFVVPGLGLFLGVAWYLWILFVGISRVHGIRRIHALPALAAQLLLVVSFPLFLREHVVEPFKIPAGSMIPTLQVGDHLLVTKFAYGWRVPFTEVRFGERSPRRGDVIVFVFPKEPDKDFIKRVIAVGGDTVDLRGNQVYVNGQPLPREAVPGPCAYEEYDATTDEWRRLDCEAQRETNDGASYFTITDVGSQGRGGGPISYPYAVPPRSVFVMGDNRDNSHDSRYWGPVPYELIKGRASIIWWSTGKGDALRRERLLQRVR